MIYHPNPPTTDRKPRIFQLNPSFLERFLGQQPAWGPVGWFTFKRTYARRLCNCIEACSHPTEEFWQTCQRVVEGCFNIQKVWSRSMGVPWNESKAQKSAQDMFQRMWEFKFTPPGRGLWMMGTDLLFEKGSAALQNCSFVTTAQINEDFAFPFCFLMDMSMLGVGVGGDTRGAESVKVLPPKTTTDMLVVEDSREGWVELVRNVLNSFVHKSAFPLVVDYSKIRPRGAPIRGFGGIASGAAPLKKLVEGVTRLLLPQGMYTNFAKSDDTADSVRCLFEGNGKPYRITSSQIVDVFNYIGKCLPGNAWVMTVQGPRQVKELVGKKVDLVIDGKVYPMESEGFFQTGTKPVLKLVTDQGWELRLTEDHQVMLADGRWVAAGQLEPGVKVRLHDHQNFSWGGSGNEDDGYVLGLLVGDGSIRDTEWGELAMLFTWDQDAGSASVRKVTGEIVERMPHRADWQGWRYNGGDGRQMLSSKALTVLAAEYWIRKGAKTVNDRIERTSSDFYKGFLRGLLDADGSVSSDRRCITLSQSDRGMLLAVQRMFGRLGILSSVFWAGREDEYVLYIGGVDAQRCAERVGFGNTRKAAEIQANPWVRGPYQRSAVAVVKALIPDGDEPVYDVTVKDVHAFDANGFYVHNCVVAGGVRRTAEIMFGEPDDLVFLDLKSNADLLPLYERKAKLTEELRGAAEAGLPTAALEEQAAEVEAAIAAHPLNDRRWASNNSVFGHVGMDYTEIAKQIAENGEPGIFWIENARRFSRMGDPADNKDYRVMGTNPCVTGDTLVFTGKGPVRADKLVGRPFHAIVDGGAYRCEGFFQTGVKPVFLLQTKEGHSIRVTADHQILMATKVTRKKRYEAWVEAQDLEPGDKVVLNNVRTFESSTGDSAPLEWAGLGTAEEGWLFGNLLGDGHFHTERETATLQFWGSTKEAMLEIALRRIESLGGDPRYHQMRTGSEVADRDLVTTGSRRLWELAPEFGISHAKEIINDNILMASSAFQSAFLRGLFDADGSVQGSQAKGVSVRLSSSNRQHLTVAQRMLMHFGINSTIYWNRRDEGTRLMPDGKGDMAPYDCEAQHELVVSNDNIAVFADRIGFDDPEKKATLASLKGDYKRSLNRERFVAVVESVTYVGVEPVFDGTIEGVHRFGANGITVHNCGEQSLEPFELCVSSDTYIQHRRGVQKIRDLVGESVDIWNGDDWSTVIPRVTGEGRELFRVHLSDGSYLDCTGNHGWHVKPTGKRVFRRVETLALTEGSQVVPFDIDAPIEGEENGAAFEWGLFAGDGFLSTSNGHTYPMVAVCGDKAKLMDLDVQGTWYKPQIVEGYTDPVNRLSLQGLIPMNVAESLRSKDCGLAPDIFRMNRESILEFVAGWIEADGSITNKGSGAEGFRLYGSEAKLRDTQLLLRRAGINHASLRLFAERGTETNLGVRNYDLYYLTIPSYECCEIPTRLKVIDSFGSRYATNNAHPEGMPIDRARKQKVVRVEKLEGLHTTYCFDEPENHMGVFGNVLTYQCNLVETYPAHHTDIEDFKATLKMAYLYSKAVTLVPCHEPRSNAVMMRNRRIGCSMSGIVQARQKLGHREFVRWCEEGYDYIKDLDRIYSEWLCVPRSIKVTTVKPSGTVSLLCGATPGIHFPHSQFYIRRIRVANTDPLVEAAKKAGYHVEPDRYADDTSVVSFPVEEKHFSKGKNDVTIWEQFTLAAALQRHWADNQVSVTVTFRPDEAEEIATCLSTFEDQLKSISMLPAKEHGYEQAPYEEIDEATYERMAARITPLDLSSGDFHDKEAEDKFCSNDSCTVDFAKVKAQ